jgi:hypothetical protein
VGGLPLVAGRDDKFALAIEIHIINGRHLVCAHICVAEHGLQALEILQRAVDCGFARRQLDGLGEAAAGLRIQIVRADYLRLVLLPTTHTQEKKPKQRSQNTYLREWESNFLCSLFFRQWA